MMLTNTTLQPLFIGSDFQLIFHIKTADLSASENIAGWALSFMVKRSLRDPDSAALIAKTTGAGGGIVIDGSFDPDSTVNEQRATVTIDDVDTIGERAGRVRWELKRTDANFERPIAFGDVELKQGVHRS